MTASSRSDEKLFGLGNDCGRGGYTGLEACNASNNASGDDESIS